MQCSPLFGSMKTTTQLGEVPTNPLYSMSGGINLALCSQSSNVFRHHNFDRYMLREMWNIELEIEPQKERRENKTHESQSSVDPLSVGSNFKTDESRPLLSIYCRMRRGIIQLKITVVRE